MSNPFDDQAFAKQYEDWYTGHGRRADSLEKRLLVRLLANFSGAETVLEVGCGTGHFSRWLAEQGFRVVGLDISPVMLSEAKKRDGVPYLVGDALALPFVDRCFDIVAFITTLEFVADPQRALGEAVRVGRRGVVLGVLNRYGLLAVKRKIRGKAPWDAAGFFSPSQLAGFLRRVAGTRLVSIQWRTTLWPVPGLKSLPLPWGDFIGIAVQLRQE
jgi:SAM-dependent methyltransferase